MADDLRLTNEQLDAVGHRNGAAIVSAAAGSGKTAVLVERVKRLFLDPEDPVFADEVVITTFTKKAAAEMRSRLEAALEKALADTAEDDIQTRERITEQQLRLKDAYICTTDSLCMNILRRYSSEAGLRPDFKVLDDSQTNLFAAQAMKTVLDRFCDANDTVTAEKRQMLYDRFAGEDDSKLEKTIEYLHKFSKKIPDANKFFSDALAFYKDPTKSAGLITDKLNEDINNMIIQPLADIQTLAAALYPLTQAVPTPVYNKDGSVSARSLTANPAADAGKEWQRLAANYAAAVWGNADFADKLAAADNAYLKAKDSRSTDYTGTTKQIQSDDIKAYISKLKKICDKLRSNAAPLLTVTEENKLCAPILEALLELTKQYDDEFARLKSAEGGLDFDDMELMTLTLLNDGNGGQSAAAKELSAAIKMIIVDEFQDSNEVQYEIYRLISRDTTNLYLVGDIKQSIYRFRGADPLVFQRLTKKGSGYRVLPLNKNFRSCKQVVDSVNAVFEGLMTVQLGDVDYNDECKLMQGASYRTDDELNKTEYIEFRDKDTDEARKREAAYVAYRIEKMVADGFKVADKGTGTRPCDYGDFAIIMSSYSSYAAEFKKALDEADIPYEAKDESEYTDLDEVKYMLSLLRVIDDPYRDSDLAAVLMKEPYLFSARELAEMKLEEQGTLRAGLINLSQTRSDIAELRDKITKKFEGELPENEADIEAAIRELDPSADDVYMDKLRQYGRKKRSDLWSGLCAYAGKDQRAAEILREIEGWRDFAAENSPARLIRRICDESLIIPSFEAGKGGLKKGLNLRMLAHYAESFPGSESASLYDFLQYLETLGKKKIKLSKADGDGSARNAVQMMTVHNSKGLEFPICFIVNVQSSGGIKMDTDGIVCDARYGIGMTVVDTKKRLKINTYTYETVKEEYDRLERSEKMRLLYVALTRAKEKLIITVPLGPKPVSKSHWGWLRDSKAYNENVFGISTDPQFTPVTVPTPPAQVKTKKINLSTDYKYRDYAAVPAKFTATQIGVDSSFEHEGRKDDDTRVLRVPSFLKSGDASKLTGKKRGDAYHKALELLDFSTSPDAVTAELDMMCERGRLSAVERATINDEDMVKFLNSELCRRAVACGKDNIYKEHPLFYEPDDSELRAICLKYGIDIAGWQYDSKPVIQGITDMFFIEGDEIVLVDYKTNTHVTEEDLIREYRGQLAVYAHALTESMGMKVKERLLYSFWLGREVSVSPE